MTDYINKAVSYYQAMLNKDFDEIGSYLHQDVSFVGPLSTMETKDAIVESAQKFAQFLSGLDVREKFGMSNKVVLIMDMTCPEPIGTFRAASFLSFNAGLISRIELFYDARIFEKKKDQIFSQS